MSDIKIKNTGIASATTANTSGGKPISAALSESTNKASFEESLKQVRKSRLDGELKEMLDRIRNLGTLFLRSPDESKLESYKNGIKDYLARIAKELFSLRQEMGSPKDGHQKVYQLIETINAEIDMLTRETLQKDNALKLLASLDEIRGLVIDLIT